MSKFRDLLPQESRQYFSALVEEWKLIARASLQAALDTADLLARSMASIVAVCSCSWLQSSGLPMEVQQSLLDLPFERTSLFSGQTDAKLHGLKDSRATLKSLSLYTPVPSRKHFRPQQSTCF